MCSLCNIAIIESPGQRKGACGHIMASFDQHLRCARCKDKGLGEDACVKKPSCEFCELLTPEQVLQLSTPTYKLRKEKKQERESLVDPSSVTVFSPVDQDKSLGASSSLNTSEDLSLPQPSFKKDLQFQGSHCTGKTGKIVKSNSRQGKHREFENFGKTQGKHREFENFRMILKSNNHLHSRAATCRSRLMFWH